MGKKEGRQKKIGNEIDIQGPANMYTNNNNETKKTASYLYPSYQIGK
jgi:hypothetical protein